MAIADADRMNPLDASFLYLEDATTHMHIASCAIFEGPPPAFEELVSHFAAKLPLVRRYRQVVRFVPLDLGRPVWVDDPGFDIADHVRHVTLPPPGAEDDLRRLMGGLMSHPLDRSRPLWEAWMVEGLEGGRWALISKVHHCMVDGVAGVDLVLLLLDPTPEPTPAPADDWHPAAPPSPLRLAADAVVQLAVSPRAQLRAFGGALREPRRALDRARGVATGLRTYGSALHPTPPTTVDGAIGPNRRWAVARSTLADVRTVRNAFGGTVNDVVLAAIAGGFRDLMAARGEYPDELAVRTLVPVSRRDDAARGIADNRVSAIFLDLPVHVADPVERLDAVKAEMARLKQSHEAEAGEALTSIAGRVPPALTALALRAATTALRNLPQHRMNTVTTNVPGPPMALFAAGREMLEYLPFVPLGPGVRIGVAILSYNGRLAFGVTGDHGTVPDLGVLVDGIERAMAAMVARVSATVGATA